MTSKKIIAFMLMICMLLSCIPAFAAQIEVSAEDVVFPEEGLGISLARSLYLSEPVGGNVQHLLVVLSATSSNEFPYRTTNNYYKGVAFSATFTQKNPPAEGTATFSVVDVPVNYTRSTGDGDLCLGILPADIIKASPELTEYAEANPGAATGDILDLVTTTAFTITGSVLNPGEWVTSVTATVDTGAFPVGTIFLPYDEFNNYPSTYTTETRDTTGYKYNKLIFRNTRANSGCMQFFVPEVSGEYNVYVQLITNEDGFINDRAVRISVDGKELKYLPADYKGTGKLPSGMQPVWCYETDDKTVNLTEGEVVAVELLGNSYGRPAAIAFVPAAANDNLYTALTADPKVRQVSHQDILRIAPKAYHPDFAKGEVTVTVNGQTVAVAAGHAAKFNASGYAAPNNSTVFGAPVRVLPATNTFPTYLTALDAVSKYIRDLGTETPVMITSINNGDINGYAVLVNGMRIYDIDWYEIKAGDVITIESKNSKSTFDPVSVKGFKEIDTGNAGTIFAIGTPTSGTGSIAGGKLKFAFDKANLAALLPFATELDDTGLKDCYLVGYLTMRKDNSTANKDLNGGADWTNMDINAKVYLENIPILGYDLNAATYHGTRVDVVTGGNLDYNGRYPYYKDPSDIRTNADGKYLVRPYQYFGDPYLYKWSNVYLVNSSTDLSIKVEKSKGKYTLKTGGCHVIDIIVATYAEDGVTVTGTDIKTEQILMFNSPIDIPLNANRKHLSGSLRFTKELP